MLMVMFWSNAGYLDNSCSFGLVLFGIWSSEYDIFINFLS